MPATNKDTKKQITELIQLNDELENYFQNTIIPQLFVDADLILRKFTPPAMKQFRFTPSHIGKPMSELVDNIRCSTIMDDIEEVIAKKEIFEKEIQTTDSRWFQMNILPYIIKKSNKANGVIITFIDITDRIKDLREIERLNASHETFIYSVSHDLRAPLANIEALVTALIEASASLEKPTPEEAKEQEAISGMLTTSIASMRDIINELSEITKIEGNYHEVPELVSFEKVIGEVKLTLRDQIHTSKAHVTVDLQEPDIEFSRKNIRSIIYNLLSNALTYRQPDSPPQIKIRTDREGEFIRLSVSDNGIGISTENQGRIFHQFTRVAKNIAGTGIGLYLVSKIVNNAGGKIEVNSKPGTGSEFVVYLKR